MVEGSVKPSQAASAPHQPARPRPSHADLAARRAGQELAEGNEIGITLVVEPFPALDEFAAKIGQMRHWPAKGSQAQAEKGQQNLDGRVAMAGAGLPATH